MISEKRLKEMSEHAQTAMDEVNDLLANGYWTGDTVEDLMDEIISDLEYWQKNPDNSRIEQEGIEWLLANKDIIEEDAKTYVLEDSEW